MHVDIYNLTTDMVEDESKSELLDLIEEIMKKLPSREQKVLEMRFKMNRSREEILSTNFKEIDLIQFPYKIKETKPRVVINKKIYMPYSKIAQRFCVSYARIRQIEKRALDRIRHYIDIYNFIKSKINK